MSQGADMESARPKKKNKKSGIIINLDSIVFVDDLLIDIFSGFPLKEAMRLACVCKRFREVIGRHDFVISHFKRSSAPPMILASEFGSIYHDPCRQFLLDMFWKSKNEIPKYVENCHIHPRYCMQLSHDGLIVSRKNNMHTKFIVYNPIYPHRVKLVVPYPCHILGVFYHPLVKEYRTIWESPVSYKPLRVVYMVLDLCARPNWREIMNPFIHYVRIRDIAPVLINEHLYWAVHSEPEPYLRQKGDMTYRIHMVELDTRTERIEVIPCPVGLNCIWGGNNISLQNAYGCLVLIQVSQGSGQHQLKINIWKLENRVNKIWTTSSEYIFDGLEDPYPLTRNNAIALWNEKLVLPYRSKDFCVCNLNKLTTTKKIGMQYFGAVTSHVMTLASLKDCNLKIRIKEDDQQIITVTKLEKDIRDIGGVSRLDDSRGCGDSEGGYGNRGGGSIGGKKCYTCGDIGHLARDCNKSGGHGGNGGSRGGGECYACGEFGHMARDCDKTKGNGCYNCGGVGHIARECPSNSRNGGGRRGGVCFNCGLEGHLARDCHQPGGGGGGGKCYTCGEFGHFSIECTN